jgi:hypothetical protein
MLAEQRTEIKRRDYAWHMVRLQIRNRGTGISTCCWTTAYDGELWTTWFEENWLKPRLKALGYTHVRFFGGKTCEYDGSFRERVCELGKPGGARAEFFVYGRATWSSAERWLRAAR